MEGRQLTALFVILFIWFDLSGTAVLASPNPHYTKPRDAVGGIPYNSAILR